MIAEVGSGLTDQGVRDFVLACLGGLYAEGPRGRRSRAEEYLGHSFVGEGRGYSSGVPVCRRAMGPGLAPVLLLQVNCAREVVSVCESL
jgi:hypothetical protein